MEWYWHVKCASYLIIITGIKDSEIREQKEKIRERLRLKIEARKRSKEVTQGSDGVPESGSDGR